MPPFPSRGGCVHPVSHDSGVFPGERPPSSMAPTVLKSQTKTLVIGASGGNMITTGIASVRIQGNHTKCHQDKLLFAVV